MFKSMLAGVSKKKIIVTVLVSLAILLPSFLAIFNIIYTNSDAASPSRDSVSVTLLDANGQQLHYEDSNSEYEGDASLTAIFKAICDRMEKIQPITDLSLSQSPITAELYGFGVHQKLVCYFSFTSGASFCIDSAGQFYKIQNEDSERFLRSAFSEYVYPDSAPPVLSTEDGENIIAKTADWFYRGFDGSFKQAQRVATTNRLTSYYATGSISLTFSAAPDYCLVRIFQVGEMIFEGSLDELAYITLDSSTPVRITVRAVWNEEEGRKFCGEMNYEFSISVRHRASFSLSTDTLMSGQFAILSATNISDISKLVFTTKDGTSIPTFHAKGDGAYAIIPYSPELEQYNFTVTYGVASKDFTVTMDSSRDPDGMAADTVRLLGIDTGRGANITNGHIFLGGNFCAPEGYGYERLLGFGDMTVLDGEEHFSVFNEYLCTDGYGMAVKSCYGGRVVYSGSSELLGNYVIVDAGLGLRLWYCGLSDVDVSVGSYVASGDVLGKSGSLMTGLGEGFMLMLSCGDSLLNADTVLGKSFEIIY